MLNFAMQIFMYVGKVTDAGFFYMDKFVLIGVGNRVEIHSYGLPSHCPHVSNTVSKDLIVSQRILLDKAETRVFQYLKKCTKANI